MEVRVDGSPVTVAEGVTVLDACDQAGRYVPRLCSYPGMGCACELGVSCGLCAVQLEMGSDRVTMLACSTEAQPGMDITTSGPALRALRLHRLAAVLDRHPHICLSCPDRDGCNRDECTYGNPPEARCCGEHGRCEFGRLVTYLDPGLDLPRRAVVAVRGVSQEGRLRREPGLCIGCGRCVVVCSRSEAAGGALRLEEATAAGAEPGRPAPHGSESWLAVRRAVPANETLRASGCTFCGQCALVCPTGAVTAPGETGARWLEEWRTRTGLSRPVLPPAPWRPVNAEELGRISSAPGVFQLADDAGRVLRIGGVDDLSRGLRTALAEPSARSASLFRVEHAQLFTQRESELLARFAQAHGHLPPGNDLGDDLFDEGLE